MLKVGDRIVCIKAYSESQNPEILIGDEGELILINTESMRYGVKWDKKKDWMHALNGRCESGHGYWVPMDCVMKKQDFVVCPFICPLKGRCDKDCDTFDQFKMGL